MLGEKKNTVKSSMRQYRQKQDSKLGNKQPSTAQKVIRSEL